MPDPQAAHLRQDAELEIRRTHSQAGVCVPGDCSKPLMNLLAKSAYPLCEGVRKEVDFVFFVGLPHIGMLGLLAKLERLGSLHIHILACGLWDGHRLRPGIFDAHSRPAMGTMCSRQCKASCLGPECTYPQSNSVNHERPGSSMKRAAGGTWWSVRRHRASMSSFLQKH